MTPKGKSKSLAKGPCLKGVSASLSPAMLTKS
jgi:hypothetical protein